jgi:integrase/recombinase XerD
VRERGIMWDSWEIISLSYTISGADRMPSKKRIWQAILGEYIKDCEMRQLGENSIGMYEDRLTEMLEDMEAKGRTTNPAKMTKEDVAYLVSTFKGTTSYKKLRVAILSGFLIWAGNPVLKHLNLKWPNDTRPNADWLEPEDAERLKAILADPLEQIVIHLMVDLGLRRCEVARLELWSIGKKYVDVQGNGRMGGKPRRVAIIPGLTQNILAAYMVWRQAELLKMHMRNKTYKEPSTLILCFNKHRRVIPANVDGVATIIKKISARAGTGFSCHTLRRTWGRTLWQAKVPIETIAHMMGHDDTKTTIKYLGIRLDDQDEAVQKLIAYRQTLIAPVVGHISV